MWIPILDMPGWFLLLLFLLTPLIVWSETSSTRNAKRLKKAEAACIQAAKKVCADYAADPDSDLDLYRGKLRAILSPYECSRKYTRYMLENLRITIDSAVRNQDGHFWSELTRTMPVGQSYII